MSDSEFDRPNSRRESKDGSGQSERLCQTQSLSEAEVLLELFNLLEQYAPSWYTKEHHNRAVAALRSCSNSIESSHSKSCTSLNLVELKVEMCFHYPWLDGLYRDILAFPKVAVCLDCGLLQSNLSTEDLRAIKEGNDRACLREPAHVRGNEDHARGVSL